MKVLFITSTRLGDAVLSTGLLDYMASQYPTSKITVVCGLLPQSIFEGFPNIERIIALQKKKHHGHWVELWKAVVGTKWDMVVDLRNSAVSRLIRSKKRFNYGRHINKKGHKVEQLAQVMGLNHIPAPKLYFTPEQDAFASHLISAGGPVIGVGPSANWIGKTWEAEKFIEIIKWLTLEKGFFPRARVAVFAAPGEEEQGKFVLESIPQERRIDGIAKGNPAEVAATISKCDFYIGNDSGLMHAAAATAVPTVGVFGPSYPHLYAPWGTHTAFSKTPETFDELIDFKGYAPEKLMHTLMTSLSVSSVQETIKRFLNKS